MPVAMLMLPRIPRLRWIVAALGGVSAEGLVPVSIGTKPSGAC